jgi:hypothetical protein
MKKLYKTAALCTAICAMAALVQTASAVSINSVTLNSTGPANPDVTFNDWASEPGVAVAIPGGTLIYETAIIMVGTTGVGAQPWPGNTRYLSVMEGGTATFTFTGTRSFFGLQWGSVDDYNTITFRLGGNSQDSFTGDDIKAWAGDLILNTGNQGVNGSAYVTFVGAFDTVVLTSSQNSFEVDNISVPEGGGTLALLGGVLAMVGLFSRKIRK